MVGYNSSDRTTMSYVSSFHHHHIYKSRKIIQRWVYARACDALQKNTSFSCGANFFSSTPWGRSFQGSWRDFTAKDRLFVTTPRTHRAAPSMRNVLSTTNIIDRLQHNVIALALLSLRPWHCTKHTSSHRFNNPLKTSRGKCLRHRPASVSLKPQISGIFPVK